MRSTNTHILSSILALPIRLRAYFARTGLVIAAATLMGAGSLSAQTPTNAPPASVEALSEKIAAQSRQLEVLTAEVAELTRLVGELAKAAGVEAPATPRAEPAAPAPASQPQAEEPVTPAGPTHLVVKGETLTAIAKQYGITVEDLKKLNQVTDERKLQIGQTLKLPPPTAPQTPESQTPAPPE